MNRFRNVVGLALAGWLAAQADEAPLQVLGPDYPRAFFFRAAEARAGSGHVPYEQWDADFRRLMGLMGKTLDEEIPGRSRGTLAYFTRFKREHPGQLVLLHMNGNARDPRWESARFFAGHWLYHNGAKMLDALPAQPGEAVIRVSDTHLFLVNMGRYQRDNDDLGLCALDEHGRPDWRRSEQVQLLAVDHKAQTLRIRRGAFGTEPRAFAAGQGYAAAHVTEGPWGKNSHLLWAYNDSTSCPRDAQHRVCSDVFAEQLGELFGPGGSLASFDGLEFDVLHDWCGAIRGRRGPDCDADGQPDAGWFGGTNSYGIGVVEFCRKLRARLGPRRLILADGALGRDSDLSQRAFGLLNGIESEGWPSLRDPAMRDWSGGLNRHFFWQQNACAPVLNYINHKFVEPAGKLGEMKQSDIPFHIHRLVFAAGMFTDAAITYCNAPEPDIAGQTGIWDELRMGTAKRLGWLGKPLGLPVRMALCASPGADMLGDIVSDEADITRENGVLQIVPHASTNRLVKLQLKNIPCSGPDLMMLLTVRSAPCPEVARLLKVGGLMTYANERDFTASFYFNAVTGAQTNLEITVENGGPLWISSATAHAHPDAIYREFEHGIVLANPALRPYTFALAKLFPGAQLCRLPGSAKQDAQTNNGAPIGAELELAPQDAIFLVKTGVHK